jgi:hypothetical protein
VWGFQVIVLSLQPELESTSENSNGRAAKMRTDRFIFIPP